jgi:hypothetical protein
MTLKERIMTIANEMECEGYTRDQDGRPLSNYHMFLDYAKKLKNTLEEDDKLAPALWGESRGK